MDRRLQDPLGSCTSSGYNSLSDHDCTEMMSPHPRNDSTGDEDWDEGDTFISFTTTETKCEELFEEGLQHKLKGELNEAIPCFLKCLEGMQECHYFAKLPQTLHTLAEIYQSLNCYDKAVEFAQAEKLFYEAVILDSTKSQVGEGKPKTKRKPFSKKPRDQSWRRGSNPAEYGDLLVKKADEYIHLAKLCAEQKSFELALDYCAKAAKVQKSVFGDTHPVTIETLNYLTVLYAEAGRAQYAGALQRACSSEKKDTVEAKGGELLHLATEESLTNGGDKSSNTLQHLSQESHTSAGLSSTCTGATTDGSLTMERQSVSGLANEHVVCEREEEGPRAKEATLLLTGDGEEEKLDSKLPLKMTQEQNPSLEQGWKEPPYKERRQDVCPGMSSVANEDCQNSPYQQNTTKGHHQETSGIQSDLSDNSTTTCTDTNSLHSCTTNEQSNMETVNEPTHNGTQPPNQKKEDITFYEPNHDANGSKQPTAVITDVLSKAPACVYVPVAEQGIEHARCLPLWVLLLGAFVELAILAYVFINRV